MKKKYCYLIILITSFNAVFAQTNSELFRLAQDAFNTQNYIASSTFYKKIINNIDSGRSEGTIPYAVAPYNKPAKKQSAKSAKSNDSISVADSASVAIKKNADTSTSSNINPDKLIAMQGLALSYKMLRSYENTEKAYKDLYEIDAPQYIFDYARALMANKKYKQAIEMTNNFMLEQEVKSELFHKSKEIIRGCTFGLQSDEQKNRIIAVTKLDTVINSSGGAFAANYFEDNNLLFSSSRTTKMPNGDVLPANSNIYQVAVDEKSAPMDNAQSLSQLLNSPVNEAACVLSPDKTKLYFTRWSNNPKTPECAIYVSKYLNGQWLTPRKLNENINVPGYRTMHPSLSPDGTTLYFVSDRPGGLGKLDIWYCVLDEMDNPKEINNAGPVVNTPDNETTPFLSANNVLYFSSEGHMGMGGLDVFKVTVDRGFMPPAKNLGAPINSSHDDAYYISKPIDETAQTGYFSSDRGSCENCETGNCYSIYYFEDKPIVITISGKVYNEDTKEPIANSMISFVDVKENYEPIFVFTDEKGEYKTKLNRDVEYFCTAQKKGFFKDAVSINTMNINKSTDLVQDFNFSLKTIPSGDIVITGIEYDLNKATLRPESKVKLDSLIEFLTLNDNLIVEISSHTDVRGSDLYNLRLSEARAQSVVDYLIEHGIEKERLVAKGYGETKPLIVDAVTEEDHQKNRRTAFRMLSQDFQPVERFKYLRVRKEKDAEPVLPPGTTPPPANR